MISLFITFFPYILVAYFLYRSYNDPVFIMGIPFLMFLGPSIFFENAVLFVIPFRAFHSIAENADILLLTWLTICWIIFKIRRNRISENIISNKFPGKHINILDYFIFSLMIITFFGLFIVLKEYYITENVYTKFLILIMLFLGFFIIKDMVRNTETEVLVNFLYSIVIVNSIASGLYFIHQGLHIELYTSYGEYLTEVVDGEIITRTFWFMPVLWFFSIAFLLVMKSKISIINIVLLSVNVLGIYISYTRSFLLIAIFLFLLYFIFSSHKNKNIWYAIRGIMIISIAGFTLYLAVSSFLPTSTKYFLDRFKDLDEKPVNAQSNNLLYRFYKTDRIVNKMNAGKVLFGYGSVTETQSSFVKLVNNATADMGWAEIVFRWGYLGLILFMLLYLISLIKAFFLFMRTDGLIAQLALIFLLTIISQVIEGFTSFTIMSPNRFALGLWYFGILSALTIASKKQKGMEETDAEYVG